MKNNGFRSEKQSYEELLALCKKHEGILHELYRKLREKVLDESKHNNDHQRFVDVEHL